MLEGAGVNLDIIDLIQIILLQGGLPGNNNFGNFIKYLANTFNFISPISFNGGNGGGILDAGIGIVQDLQSGGVTGVIGAIQKAGTTYNTFKGANIKSVVNEEANAALKGVIRNSIPGAVRQQQNGSGGFTFPRSPGYGRG